MKKVAPKLLPGFMELLPKEQIVFNQMKDIIRKNYEKFGFVPIDSPVLHSSEVLLAKAGGETEKQIYRFSKGDTDMCLRFDLTVPLARYLSANYNELTFPFRCYQIGKSYRGERPQRGRFREFYQCDIDVIGKDSLSTIYDAEIPSVMYQIIKEFNIGDFVINISNRTLLAGFIESCGLESFNDGILKYIDKFDKIGAEKVKECLTEDVKMSQKDAAKIMSFIEISGSTDEKLAILKDMNINCEKFVRGVSELEDVVKNMRAFGIPDENFTINFAIVRGLDYYTGTVYETFLKGNENLGSICSGGRYENLTSHYVDQKLVGVGMSIGLTRLFHTLTENSLLKEQFEQSISDVIILPMEKEFNSNAIEVAKSFRENGIKTEVYFEDVKFKNKLAYANKQQIKFVVILGEDEVKQKILTLKNLESHEQISCSISDAIKVIKTNKQTTFL